MIDSSTRDSAASLDTFRPEARVDSPSTGPASPIPLILSFDVEEHHLIEAAAGLVIDQELQERYRGRMRETTEWLLDRLPPPPPPRPPAPPPPRRPPPAA